MKQKVFDVCAGLISISEFEEWLYTDAEIRSAILEDAKVLRLCSIDLSKNDAEYELRKFCLDSFDQEEYHVYQIEGNSQNIVDTNQREVILSSVNSICKYAEWNDEKALFSDFYQLMEYYSDFLIYSEYGSKSEIINEMKSLANDILEAFNSSSMEEKKIIVFKGLDRDLFIPQWNPQSSSQSPKKRWYQFWK